MHRTVTVVATAALVAVLAACSSPPTPTIAAGPPATATARATPTPAPAATYGSSTRNERGNLLKNLGQPAGTTAGDNTTVTLDFRVDAIRQHEDCAASGFTEEPVNGQFLGLDLFAKTTAAYTAGQDDTELLVSGYSWSVITADGVRHNVDTSEAWVCSPASRKNLGGLSPSVTVMGTIFLDAPADLAGAVVVLRPPGRSDGWEWQIPSVA